MASRKSGIKSDDLKQEDFLQAVVVADSFNVRFVPLTNDKPRTLLPLVNVPLLEYTLEFLSTGGVQRAIVFCCSFSEQIKNYLKQSKWMKSNTGMEVMTVVSDGCMSLGDALRDLEAKSIIRNDFVLVHGDLVANLNLAPIVEEHRKRRSVVKSTLITMVYKEAPPQHSTRRPENELVVAVDSKSQRVVGYQRVGHSAKKFVLQHDALKMHSAVQIRHDFLDCHIAVCSPNMLQLMADNFDFETVDDLVRDILVNEEVLDFSMYIHTVHGSQYAARVSDVSLYAAVSQDVMSRWVFPFVPDRNWTNELEDSYAHHRHNVYLNRDVTLKRGSTLRDNVTVGQGSIVAEDTVVLRSVIGKRCQIGKNVKIMDSYIWDDVIIEDNCVVTGTILGSNVKLGGDCEVKGSLVGSNIVLKNGMKISPGTKLVSHGKRKIDAMDIVPFGSSNGVLEYRLQEGETRKPWDTWGLPAVAAIDQDVASSSSSESEDEDDTGVLNEEKVITDEISLILERAADENVGSDNVIVEINSVKHAYGVQIKELNTLLMKTILELPLMSTSSESAVANQYFVKFKSMSKRFLPILQNYFRGLESQKDMILALEQFGTNNESVLSVLPKVVHLLYDECDVLSEQVILEWWKQMTDNNRSPSVRKNMEKFIQWLKTAEEEDSSED